MTRQISEPDWKIYRQLHPIALDRFCQRVLAEVGELITRTSETHHERYLAVYQLMKRRDKELARVFDELRRSTALQQLALFHYHKLLTDDELARLSPATREAIQVFLSLQRA